MRCTALFSALAFALLMGGAGTVRAQSVTGAAQVIDGDTLDLTGTRIRLFGVDAVESRQICSRGGSAWACGEDAKARLSELVAGRNVQCSGRDIDVYGRLVAVCRAGGIDLAESMVLAGLAVALTDFSSDYVDAQARASRFGLGVWDAEFQQPADWRAAHPEAAPKPPRVAPAAPAKVQVYRNSFGCAIKGNHSRRGDWIYYLPGQPYYEETRPEALFCTEAAAQAAGYRPTRAR